MHSRKALFRTALVGAALLLATLACNLQIGAGPNAENTPIPTVERPTVEIIEPQEGATFTVGQTITVRARASSASGVTLVELLVNGVRVASQPPAEAVSPNTLDVVLDYKPERPGTITLAVRAYSNAVVGLPAQRRVTVLPELASGGATPNPLTALPPTPTPYNPICRARINTNLNFRTGPSTDYPIILTFSAGQEPPITGYADRPDGKWWQVQWGGQVGWVKASYTTQLGNCSGIGPATYPALPTPTPTETPPPTAPGTTATPTLPDLGLSLLEGPTEITLDAFGQAQGTYIIRVINSGGQPAGAFRVAVLQPSGEVVTFDVPGLNAGQELTVPGEGLTVTFTNPGFTRILVTVDDDNRVLESDETNNQAYRDINVQYGPPTVTPAAQPTDTPLPTATQAPDVPTNTPMPTATPLPTDTPTTEPTPFPTATVAANTVTPLEPITAANAALVGEVDSMAGHGSTITALAFNSTGNLLASASLDGTARLWDAYTDVELAVLPHSDRVLDVAFSPDGTRLATVTQDGMIHIWDVASGIELLSYSHGAEAHAVAFSPGGTRLVSSGLNPDASGGLQGLARVWEAGTGNLLASYQTFGMVSGVGFLNEDTVVVGTQGQDCSIGGGSVELFSVSSGSADPALVLVGTGDWVNALSANPAAALIAASGRESLCAGNGMVRVWHGGGSLLAALDHGGSTEIADVAFNLSGTLLTSASSDGRVRLWDLSTSAQVALLNAHPEAASVAFSPDGTLVASGGSDGVIKLWGVATTN